MACRRPLVKRYLNALSAEIAKESSCFAEMSEKIQMGEATCEDSSAVRGYFKGLKAARDLLDREIQIYEESVSE